MRLLDGMDAQSFCGRPLFFRTRAVPLIYERGPKRIARSIFSLFSIVGKLNKKLIDYLPC